LRHHVGMRRGIVEGDDYSVLPAPMVRLAHRLSNLLRGGDDDREKRSTWLAAIPTDQPPCALTATVRLVDLTLRVVQESVELTIDGFTDCDHLPPTAERALAAIRVLGDDQARPSWRGRPDPTHMAVMVDAADEAQRRAFIDFAPYSIHAEIHVGKNAVLTLHDSGSSVELNLTDAEHAALLEAPGFAKSGARLLRP
jgi:hypothetical protein